MRNGLARELRKQVVDKLKEGFFSFNIDKVLTLLVSYFCGTKNEVVVEHLGSLNLPTVNSETVFKFNGSVNEFVLCHERFQKWFQS